MSILDKIKAFLPTKRQGVPIGIGMTSGWAIPSERNLPGYLKSYGELYSVFGIALRIATAVSEVKWRLYKGSERSVRSQIAEHSILDLLDFANEFQTGQEVIELTQLGLDLSGRAYWYIPRNGSGVPAEIWVIPPHQIKIVPDAQKFIAGYIYTGGKELMPLETKDIIRFTMPDPLDPYGGIGFIQPSSVEIDSAIYQGKWNRNWFFNSAKPDGVISTEETLTDKQYEALKEQWGAQHQGLSEAHKIAILQGGLKYQQIGVSQKDMDFAQLSRQSRENLLFAFGMPLSVMGIVENVNRANAEAGDYTFSRWLVKPRLTRIRNKLNEQLLPKFSGAKGLELDFDEVVPETVEQKRLLAESGVRTGIITINEGRKLYGLDPLAIGDQLLIPLNLIPTHISPNKYSVAEAYTAVKEMDEGYKELRWQVYALKTARIESQFIRVLKNLWDSQESEVKDNLSSPDVIGTPQVNLFDEIKANQEFSDRLKPVIQMAYAEGIETADTKQEEFLDPLALDWIANRSLTLAKDVNITTMKLLRKTLAEGFAQGESIPDLAKRIRQVYLDCDKTRSLMIARTEVITASSKGAEDRYKEMGVEKLEWYTALDERTCEECDALHGNEYAIGDGPRPALHPMCRCQMLPIIA